VQAHTGNPHVHLTSHGIVSDGGGWYHKSIQGACYGDTAQTVHKHYTYLAAKKVYVYKHSTISYKSC
jgi:hypothetical protein